MKDKLDALMFLQQSLQEDKMGIVLPLKDPKELALLTMKHFVYMIVEFAEVFQELPYFKDWKDYDAMTEEDIAAAMIKVKKEYIDAVHFFFNMALFIDLSPTELFDEYCEKNNINHVRQVEGYAWRKPNE